MRPRVAITLVLIGWVAILAPGVSLQAWSPHGHMVVAFIAYQHLNTKAKNEVGRLLKLNPQHASWVQGLPTGASADRRTRRAFVKAAGWADFIKGAPGFENDGETPPPGPQSSQNIGYADKKQHRYWHFINVPFSDDGTPTRNPPGVNAQSQIELLRTALASPGTSDDIKSYDLVWLEHLVGDIHQPLHAVARFTHADTDGDRGGNDVNQLQCPAALNCARNLHALWDGLLGSSENLDEITSLGTTLGNGPAPPGADVTDVAVWIQESVDLSKAKVYKRVSGTPLGDPSATLDAAYLNRARTAARERAVLAARRLAKLINDVLGQ